MSQIRRNNNSTAAAVFDTAGVAASTIIRGPLHPASQGPLAPVAVSDTAAVVATQAPVAVSDTAAVPCLKSVFKYSSNKTMALAQHEALAREDRLADAWDEIADLEPKHFVDILETWVVKFQCRRAIEDVVLGFTSDDFDYDEWLAQWKDLKEETKRQPHSRTKDDSSRVEDYHKRLSFQATVKPCQVSFGTVTEHTVSRHLKQLHAYKQCDSHPHVDSKDIEQGDLSLDVFTDNDWDDEEEMQELAEDDFKNNNLPSQPLPRVQGVAFKGEDRWEVQSDTPPQTQQQQRPQPQPQRSEVQSDTPPQTQQQQQRPQPQRSEVQSDTPPQTQQQRPQPQRSEVQSDTPPQAQQQQATTTRSRRRQQPASASSQPVRRSRRLAGHSAEVGTRRSIRIAKKAPVCYTKFF